MYKNILILIIIIFLNSCASITLKYNYSVDVKSNLSDSKVKVYDTIYNLPAKIKVERSSEDLTIELISDTLTKKYIIISSLSKSFLFGNLVFMTLAPVGYLIDFTNQKRFEYGDKIFLNSNDTSNTIDNSYFNSFYKYLTKNFPCQKGNLYLFLSIPCVNSFKFKPIGEETKNNTGFWGFSAGLEYYYHESNFLSLNISAVTDIFAPVPGAIDMFGEWQRMNAISISLTNNNKDNRFIVGYGVNYSINSWSLINEDYDPNIDKRQPVTKTNHALGFTTNFYFQFNDNFLVGLIYKPTILNIYPLTKFQYEHVISLDFAVKFKIVENLLK